MKFNEQGVGMFKVIRLICVDCGLIRHPLAKGACPRCESEVTATAKVAK